MKCVQSTFGKATFRVKSNLPVRVTQCCLQQKVIRYPMQWKATENQTTKDIWPFFATDFLSPFPEVLVFLL